jgi:hypothetical protein
MLKITVSILTGLTVISLLGCAVPVAVSIATGAASVAVNETTGKTVTDHTVSAINGKDCKVSRMGKEDICQDEVSKFRLRITTTGVTPSTTQEIQARYQ